MTLWRRLFHFEPRLDQQVEEILKSGKTHEAAVTGVHGVGESGVESKAGAQAKVDAHATRTDNPHNVTAAQAGAVPTTDVVTTPTANKILKLNGDAKLPASITGDAETVDGMHATAIIQLAVPPGAIMDFAMPTPPAGWLECDGSAVSRTTYAALFAAIGTIWGVGDGTTTFNLPDFRGEFRRGWDHGRGIDAGRGFASWQADELKSHSHAIDPILAISATRSGTYGRGSGSREGFELSSTGATGGTETRPRNRAVLTCIKT